MKLEVFLSSDELSRHLGDLIPRLKKAKHKVKVHNILGPFDAMKALSLGIKSYPAIYVKETGEIKEGREALLYALQLLGVKISEKPIESALEERAGEVPTPPLKPRREEEKKVVEEKEKREIEKKPILRRPAIVARHKPPKRGAAAREPEYYAALAETLLSDGAYAGFASASSLEELEEKIKAREGGVIVLDMQVKIGREWKHGVIVYDNGRIVYARIDGLESRSIEDIISVLKNQAQRITVMVYRKR